jgi:ribosome-associated toxin RatA of RatAB toxin-antitoxin module
MRFSLFILLISLGAYFSPLDSARGSQELRFGEAELGRLAQGEVIVHVDRASRRDKARVRAAIFIDSPAQQIWNIMVDCDRAPEFVPGLRGCKVLEQNEDSDIIEHRVKFSWFLPTVTYIFRAHYRDFSRIDFTRVGGDLRELEGNWILEQPDDGQGTIVVYSVYVDAGFLVPQWLIRRILRGNLPDLLLALRNRVSELSRE